MHSIYSKRAFCLVASGKLLNQKIKTTYVHFVYSLEYIAFVPDWGLIKCSSCLFWHEYVLFMIIKYAWNFATSPFSTSKHSQWISIFVWTIEFCNLSFNYYNAENNDKNIKWVWISFEHELIEFSLRLHTNVWQKVNKPVINMRVCCRRPKSKLE